MTCSEGLSAAKSSFSQGPLPLKEVPWNIGISGAHPMALALEKLLWHHTSVVSSSCPILIWESRRKNFVTSRWRLGWYPWVFWSIKLSLVNTISGFLRGTNALEKKKMSFIDPVPKAVFSYNYGYAVLVLWLLGLRLSLTPLAGFQSIVLRKQAHLACTLCQGWALWQCWPEGCELSLRLPVLLPLTCFYELRYISG